MSRSPRDDRGDVSHGASCDVCHGVFHDASDGDVRRLEDKPGEVSVSETQAIIVETPGAGGYGSPQQRSDEHIAADRVSGKFSKQYIQRNYGK